MSDIYYVEQANIVHHMQCETMTIERKTHTLHNNYIINGTDVHIEHVMHKISLNVFHDLQI